MIHQALAGSTGCGAVRTLSTLRAARTDDTVVLVIVSLRSSRSWIALITSRTAASMTDKAAPYPSRKLLKDWR